MKPTRISHLLALASVSTGLCTAGAIAEVARDTTDYAMRKRAIDILARGVTNEKVTQQVCQALGHLDRLPRESPT